MKKHDVRKKNLDKLTLVSLNNNALSNVRGGSSNDETGGSDEEKPKLERRTKDRYRPPKTANAIIGVRG